MSILPRIFSSISKSLNIQNVTNSIFSKATGIAGVFVPERTKYTDWRMLRDANRRKVVKQYAPLRLQINSLRYNTILPQEIRDIASKEIHALPRASNLSMCHGRCVLTSRARGRWAKFRMSRIVWRHFADYNLISGAERAMW
ncbi:28S ribosomal protein S14, mitochondrial-like [Uloborus diversus]|uniref:28S ribosomal protein S14, mitochondrial-like n=1 Tax=Uloborus diversus TaxID=327109 RepID=UPI002409C9B6|nr:28S ribosomal protein S14, mitochondrial-like [Uloborus diversus]